MKTLQKGIKQKKIIVTGGAGFIGSHLVDRLLADGHQITVLDNFATGRWENLAQHSSNKRLRIINYDISNLNKAEFPNTSNDIQINSNKRKSIRSHSKKIRVIREFKDIDWVFHLAALADIVPSIVHPIEYHRANVDGIINVLEASRKAHVNRFVYAASSSCYGIPNKFPTPETDPISPRYPYAFTKWIGEEYVLHWGRVYKLPVVSLRLFNVYGPRSRTSGTYGAVFGTFLAQKLAGKPFTIVGDGKQSRDFTFVSDVVDAFIKAAESNVTNEVFNVGSGQTYSVNHLVKLLDGAGVVYIPKRPGEPDCTLADISKIKRKLNWKPKVKFEEGIKILLQNIDYWRDAPVWTPEKIKHATKEWFEYLGR